MLRKINLVTAHMGIPGNILFTQVYFLLLKKEKKMRYYNCS